MQSTLIDFINDFGYLAVGALIFIESIFPPIPSEVVLVFGGFMTTYTQMNVWAVMLSATAGSLLGALVLYFVGWYIGKERLKRLLTGKVGKRLRIKPESLTKADHWFARYGYKAVLICRCVPIVRSLISIPAGISQMKLAPFLLLTVLGSAAWNTIFAWLGVISGEAWEANLHQAEFIIKIIIAAIVIAAIVWFVIKKRRTG